MSRRAWLLAALGVAVVAFVANLMWPDTAATSGPPASNQQRRGTAARGQTDGVPNPDELKVRLEVLDEERPAPGGAERNPFRFKPVAPPAPPPGANATAPPPMVPSVPPGPPAPPPITLKFMGIVVRENGVRIAQLSDCKGATWAVAEGGSIDGRYRLVSIGLESVVLEYVDGKGRQTIRLEGCPPRT